MYAVAAVGQWGITGVSGRPPRAVKGERYLGLGERSDAVDHRGRSVRNRVPTARVLNREPGHHRDRRGARPWARTASPTRPASRCPGSPRRRATALVDKNDEDSTFQFATAPTGASTGVLGAVRPPRPAGLRGPTPAAALPADDRRGQAPAGAVDPLPYGAWFEPRGDAAPTSTSSGPPACRSSVVRPTPTTCRADRRSPIMSGAPRRRRCTRGRGDHDVSTRWCDPMTRSTAAGLDASASSRNPTDTAGLPVLHREPLRGVAGRLLFRAAGVDFFTACSDGSVADGYDGWMEDGRVHAR